MSLDIRWLVPVAIYAVAPQCIAAKYMNVDQARALIFPFADEYVVKPWRHKKWERKAASGDKEAQELLRMAASAHVDDE